MAGENTKCKSTLEDTLLFIYSDRYPGWPQTDNPPALAS
jgi:hypothetical protein